MNEINLLGEPRVFRANMLNLNRISKNSSPSTELTPSKPGSKPSQIDFANILKEISSPGHVAKVDVDYRPKKVLGSTPSGQKNLMPDSSQLHFNNDTNPNVSRISTEFVRSMYNALGKA
jgi:hypothetical protein